MRKLSKFLAIGAILALGLTACGSSQKADTTSAAGESSASESKGAESKADAAKTEGSTTVKIGVVGENNEQWNPCNRGYGKRGYHSGACKVCRLFIA